MREGLRWITVKRKYESYQVFFEYFTQAEVEDSVTKNINKRTATELRMESSSLLIALAIVCFCLFFLRVSDVQYDMRYDSSLEGIFFSCRSLSLPIASICCDPRNMWYKSSKVRTKVNVNICTSFSLTWPCLQEMDSCRVVIKVLHLISRCWLSVGRLNEACKLLRSLI